MPSMWSQVWRRSWARSRTPDATMNADALYRLRSATYWISSTISCNTWFGGVCLGRTNLPDIRLLDMTLLEDAYINFRFRNYGKRFDAEIRSRSSDHSMDVVAFDDAGTELRNGASLFSAIRYIGWAAPATRNRNLAQKDYPGQGMIPCRIVDATTNCAAICMASSRLCGGRASLRTLSGRVT